jgi:predicted DCC family thiol-disulfide oxidoreductase YuxK
MEKTGKSVLIYDGVCNLCTTLIHWVIHADKTGKIALAPFQSRWAAKWLSERGMADETGNTVIYLSNDKVYLRSSAILCLFKDLGGLWKITGIFYILPVKLRDTLYTILSRNRYLLFGRKNSYIIPGPGSSDRFIE